MEFSAVVAVFAFDLGAILRQIDRDFLDAAFLHLGEELRVAGFLFVGGLRATRSHLPKDDSEDYHYQPE